MGVQFRAAATESFFFKHSRKLWFFPEHLGAMSTVAHYEKPLGSVSIIFGCAEEKGISVPKYLQTIEGGCKTTPDQNKTGQEPQK